MKAELTFDMDQPADREAHMRCVKATELALCLWELDQWLRAEVRRDTGSAEWRAGYQCARDVLHEFMDHHGVRLEELLS